MIYYVLKIRSVDSSSHWLLHITIFLFSDIDFLPGGDRYKPVIYFNEFWNMLRDYQPINETCKYVTNIFIRAFIFDKKLKAMRMEACAEKFSSFIK